MADGQVDSDGVQAYVCIAGCGEVTWVGVSADSIAESGEAYLDRIQWHRDYEDDPSEDPVFDEYVGEPGVFWVMPRDTPPLIENDAPRDVMTAEEAARLRGGA